SRRAVILALAVAASLAAAPPAPPPASAPKFPFKVSRLSGGTIGSEDLKGKIAVIDVWATWCGPCRLMIPHLIRMHDKFKSKGVTVVGINADEKKGEGSGYEHVKQFVAEKRITYPIGLMDGKTFGDISKLMGHEPSEGFTMPTTIVVGRNGDVVMRYGGYFPGQERELEALIEHLVEPEAKP
ncbi:MAG TPA: TlpA disulfide reductase family protein, partial [Candidatus Polarisedimenticolia bacterium]|nr:TlpA disulfide reductase family protein [Candidatus Polarisedimenticolia bacterium]